MKRTFALLVATLAFVAASSIQAAEAPFQIFSQTEGQRLKVANDIHYSVVDAEGQKVADGANDYEFSVDVPVGEYVIVVEQESTNFAGSINIVVDETNEICLLKLDRSGLALITDAHACPNHHDGQVSHAACEDDSNCICKRVYPQCDTDGLYAPTNSVTSTQVPSTISPNPLPNSNPMLPQASSYNQSAYGAMGGGMGSLAILGAIGAVIAVAVTDSDDNRRPYPVSSMYRYR